MIKSDDLPSQAITLKALLNVLGKSQSEMHITEIEFAVANHLSLTKSQMEVMHKGKRTLLGYKLAWARTAAKKQGLIESPRKSIWRSLG